MARGITGTSSDTWPAFWKFMFTRTYWPPLRIRVRCTSSTRGDGPVRNSDCLWPRLIPPIGTRTDVAAAGALMLISRSGTPSLVRARNTPAEAPRGSEKPGAGPSTNMLLIRSVLFTIADAPAVG